MVLFEAFGLRENEVAFFRLSCDCEEKKEGVRGATVKKLKINHNWYKDAFFANVQDVLDHTCPGVGSQLENWQQDCEQNKV